MIIFMQKYFNFYEKWFLRINDMINNELLLFIFFQTRINKLLNTKEMRVYIVWTAPNYVKREPPSWEVEVKKKLCLLGW